MKAFLSVTFACLLSATALLLGASASPTGALAADVVPVAQEAPCSTEAYRQFDFWIGEWTVTRTADGQLAGTNKISKAFGNCVIREEYSSPSGYAGSSFNLYDAGQDVWHQTWVDNTGLLLELDGQFMDGKMVLEGERPGPDGTMQLHQITWEAQEDGTVRQIWTTSSDDGMSWSTAFDGTYTRASADGD